MAFTIFSLACGVLVATVPSLLFNAPPQTVIETQPESSSVPDPVREGPGEATFVVAGTGVVLLTAGLFASLGRLGLGLKRRALVLALGYNSLIAVVKFVLAPAAMYDANSTRSFDTLSGDPNGAAFYAGVGAVILGAYLLTFWVAYRVFRRRTLRRIGEGRGRAALGGSGDEAKPGAPRIALGVILGAVAIGAVCAVTGAWVLPFILVVAPVISYLSWLFGTALGVAILLALALAFVLAMAAFKEAEESAVALGDATVLAGFFWLAVALLLIFHFMWAVFLLALVSVYPFQTHSPE